MVEMGVCRHWHTIVNHKFTRGKEDYEVWVCCNCSKQLLVGRLKVGGYYAITTWATPGRDE